MTGDELPATVFGVPVFACIVQADRTAAAQVRAALLRFALDHGADPQALAAIANAVSEAVSNAAEHAYAPGEAGVVHVTADVEDGALEVLVADEGRGLRPGSDGGLGLGLALIAELADRFSISGREPHGVAVWMRFALTS